MPKPERPCKPYISGERVINNGYRDQWTWTLECDHDIQASGPFPELITIANDHVRRQTPQAEPRTLAEFIDQIDATCRLVLDDDLIGERA